HPLRREERAQVSVHLLPVLLELVERVDLLGPEVGLDQGGTVTELDVEAVTEAVGGVGADHQGAVTETRAGHRGGGGDGGLPDPALAGVEDHSHRGAEVYLPR